MHRPKKIEATAVRFIKLGRKGLWEKDCIEGSTPTLRLGFRSKQHAACLARDWTAVTRYWATTGGKKKGTATDFTNQIRTFYEADERTLWITFFKRKLYWCFASANVKELPDGTRTRKTLGAWSCEDVNGNVLHAENLSGALTKVQGFRGTICSVDQSDYLLQRLNGKTLPEVDRTLALVNELAGSVEGLIQKLGWKDFELLCDLLLTRAGWQRISSLGKTQKAIDLELLSPVTGRRAFVQIKSQSNLETFLRYKADFESMSQYDEMYYIVHSPTKELVEFESEANVFLLSSRPLARLVVSSGLTEWLLRKVS